MASSENVRPQDDSSNRRRGTQNRKIEPPRKAPQTERGLTHSPYFNGPLYQRMSEDLHLGGMSKRTHEGYLRAIRQLPDFCKLSPDQITEERVKWLMWLYLGWTYWLASGVAPQPERHQNRIRCKDCGGELCVIAMTNAGGRVICRMLPDHATSFLDSG